MKKFIIKLLIFCIAPMAVLIPLGYMVDAGLHKSRQFYYAEWNDLFGGKINADMLILGTSRAWVHFSPQIIDSGLHINSYNLGMDATPFNLQYERLKIYLRYNKKPKYILQEVGFNTTLMMSRALPMYQQFLPYLNDSAIWKIYCGQYDNVTLIDKYFPLYKYNNMLPVIKEGLWAYFGKGRPAIKYKGYQGQDKGWDGSYEEMVKNNPEGITWRINPKALALFKSYIQFCKDNDIELIMVYTPYYYEMKSHINNNQEVSDTLLNVARAYNVPYLNYTEIYLDSSKTYFYNSQHLNKHGSELFTRLLVNDLKPLMHEQADGATDSADNRH